MEKKHFYSFIFFGTSSANGLQSYGNSIVGLNTTSITMERINIQRSIAGLTEKSILINLVYLGHMTIEEFNGIEEEK